MRQVNASENFPQFRKFCKFPGRFRTSPQLRNPLVGPKCLHNMRREALSYEQVRHVITETIPLLSLKPWRDVPLFALLYGTAARVGEFLQIRARDIEIQEIGNSEFLVVSLITEKNRRKPIRRVPISIEKENWITEPILEYVDGLEPDYPLFQLSTRRIQQLSKKYFQVHPHFLRHSRLTHLVQIYNFNDRELVQIAGWTDSKPAQVYVHLRWSDLAMKMISR